MLLSSSRLLLLPSSRRVSRTLRSQLLPQRALFSSMSGSDDQGEAGKLWGGRFSGATDPLMEKYNQSLSFDQRMWKQDLRGSRAYASALARAGILTDDERDSLHKGLRAVEAEWASGAFVSVASDEDIHTANERRLSEPEFAGAVGGKLHESPGQRRKSSGWCCTAPARGTPASKQ